MSEKTLLTAQEAAELLGVEVHWLEKRRGNKAIPNGPPYIRLGGFVSYRKEELKEYIKNLPLAGGQGAGVLCKQFSDSMPEEKESSDGTS